MLTLLIVAVAVGAALVFLGISWLGYGLIAASLLIRAVTMPEQELLAAAMGALAILFVGIPGWEWYSKLKRDKLKSASKK